MLHLALVTQENHDGVWHLHILASQRAHEWEKCDTEIPFTAIETWPVGSWVMVETDEHLKVLAIKEAIDGLLPLLPGKEEFPTPLLRQEKERVEAWRQEMVSRNLELTRQQIELETLRQQLSLE